MVKRADVVLEWADGEYLFALKGAQIEALEAECRNPDTGKNGIGISAIWMRLMGSSWYMSDVTNVIRLGLIGGGMAPVPAMRLVRDYVDTVPLSSLSPNLMTPDCPLTVARAILAAAFVGVPESSSSGEEETPES